MKVSIVKKATVEVVDFSEVKEGDYILFGNKKAKVLVVYPNSGFSIQLFPEDSTKIIKIPSKYYSYYKILDCELMEATI